MERQGTWDRVRRTIVAEMGVEHADVAPGVTLESLGMDSLDSVELCMAIEDEFGVDIADAEWEGVFTVDDILSVLDRRAAALRR